MAVPTGAGEVGAGEPGVAQIYTPCRRCSNGTTHVKVIGAQTNLRARTGALGRAPLCAGARSPGRTRANPATLPHRAAHPAVREGQRRRGSWRDPEHRAHFRI